MAEPNFSPKTSCFKLLIAMEIPWDTYFGKGIFACILVAEKGQDKCAIAYGTKSFFRISKNVCVSVGDEFRPNFITKPPHNCFPLNTTETCVFKKPHTGPLSKTVSIKKREFRLSRGSILQYTTFRPLLLRFHENIVLTECRRLCHFMAFIEKLRW